MSRATARCFSLLRISPSPLSVPLPRRFRLYPPDSASDFSPPSPCYAIANGCTLAHPPAIARLWPVWNTILSSDPFSLNSERIFQNSGSQDLGFVNFADQGEAMEHQNLLWKDTEVTVENGWPFLFKDAADTIARMKLFLSGRSPVKFFPSYGSTPLFSTVLYSLFSTERYTPQRTRFPKQQRGRMKGISSSGNRICFGRYALQALEPAWITSGQLEAGRRAMTRFAGRDGKLWVRIFPDKPVTARPAETQMGRGKGNPVCWVAVVKPGRILYEVSGVTEKIAREAIAIAASKMPIRTQILISE